MHIALVKDMEQYQSGLLHGLLLTQGLVCCNFLRVFIFPNKKFRGRSAPFRAALSLMVVIAGDRPFWTLFHPQTLHDTDILVIL